ncbi:MAG: hypothetical protein A2252_00705 [Elusimicrobia bacterium RIFOXYA2_FULL_39_19]|nr:MAG: hypothetical protein A2252_00705 [Elusimicrobia bacterium RIFOXYA2_FULL_39_19]
MGVYRKKLSIYIFIIYNTVFYSKKGQEVIKSLSNEKEKGLGFALLWLRKTQPLLKTQKQWLVIKCISD